MTGTPRARAVPAQRIAFVVPGEPVPKARARVTRRATAYTPPRTVAAEEKVQQYLKVKYPALQPVDAPWGLSVAFHVKTQGRGDVDNYLKLVMDALTGCVWSNDRQVRSVAAEMVDFSKEPRTVIAVHQIHWYETLEPA